MYIDIFKRYVPVIILLVLAALCIMIVRPFFMYIVAAMILAYSFYPLYRVLFRFTKRSGLSSFLMCMIVILIIMVPLVMITNAILVEAPRVISSLRSNVSFTGQNMDEFSELVHRTLGFKLDFSASLSSILTYLVEMSRRFLFALPNAILGIFVMLLFLYYMFCDGAEFILHVRRYIPFRKEHKDLLTNKIKTMISAVIYGHIITAILQGIVASIGYFIFGVKAPIFLGLLTTLLAMFPLAGPPLVYVPVSLGLMIYGVQINDLPTILRGAFLLAYGMGIISVVDNIVKPKIISDQAKVHPMVILLGVFGGLYVFGILGFILGPIIFAVFIETLKVYASE